MDSKKQGIDLHIHSIHSDGTCSTQQLLDQLQAKNVRILSFTDHDSVGCYDDLRAGTVKLYPGMTLIPGVELSCRLDGRLRDILGYGVSIRVISEYLEKKYSSQRRLQKQQHILEQLMEICQKHGLRFNSSLRACEGKKAEAFVILYNELNRYPENIERCPFVSDNTKFYWNYFSNPDSDFFVDETYDLPTISEAVDTIHLSGGKAFLAHPYAYGMDQAGVEHLVQCAVKAKVDGIELKHSSNKNGDVDKIRAFAKKYHLLFSGGTDFHGATKPGLELVSGYGNMLVHYSEIAPWIKEIKQVWGGSNENIPELWT